jgi:hypothetical protein
MGSFTQAASDAVHAAARYSTRPETVDDRTTTALRSVMALLIQSLDKLSRLMDPEAAPPVAALPVCFLPADVAVLAARPAPRSLHLVRTFKVEGVPMDVHIDSCSPFCLVNADSLSPAQRAQVRLYTGPRLVGGNAGGMNVRGQYSGHLEINSLKFRVPWLVVDNLPMQRILG